MFSGTPEQCFLLGYRALARELYTKRAAVAQSGLRQSLDKGKTPAEQVLIQATIRALEIGLAAGLRDIKCRKTLYDGILESRRFAPVRAYIIEFEHPPPVMCSGGNLARTGLRGCQFAGYSRSLQCSRSSLFHFFPWRRTWCRGIYLVGYA